MDEKFIARQVALSCLNVPYKWGGNSPLEGLDCSGFVIVVLKAVGKLPQKGDWTAQSIYNLLNTYRYEQVSMPREGCVAFFGQDSSNITHVEYCLSTKHCIGASSGDSSTKDLSSAILRDARVKIKPISSRTDLVCFIDLFPVVD